MTPWSGDATFSVCKLDFTSFTKIASSGSEGRSARRAAPGVGWPTSCACARTGATGRAIFALPRRGRSCRSSPRNSGLPCRRRKSACRRKRRPGIFRICRFAAGLAEIGEVTLEPTSGGADRQRWRSMMETHHPRAQPPGAQLGYWIVSSRHGRLGGIGFCAASWHQKARDEFVGWSADARVANLQLMVNRFLLLPGVRVHELASHVLDLAAMRLPGDWEAAYGVRPLMAYTYVSPDQRLLSCGKVGALRQADVGAAAGRRGERRRAVGETVGRRLERAAAPGTGTDARLRSESVSVRRLGEYGRGTRGRTRRRMVGRAWEARPGEPVPVPGQGRSGPPAVVEPESAPRSRIPQGMHGRALPQGARRSGGSGHDDAELQRAGSHA